MGPFGAVTDGLPRTARPRDGRLITRPMAVVPAATVSILYGASGTAKLRVLGQVVLGLQSSFAVFPPVRFTSDREKMGEFVNFMLLYMSACTVATSLDHVRRPATHGSHRLQGFISGTVTSVAPLPGAPAHGVGARAECLSANAAASQPGNTQPGSGERVSAPVEDYLKAIYDLAGRERHRVHQRGRRAARLSPASVTGMIRRLAEQELLEYERYRGVRLSESGRLVALRTIRRHRIIEAYLTERARLPVGPRAR